VVQGNWTGKPVTCIRNLCTTTVQCDRFYLTPLLIAVAYFLARPLPTKSS
jgi:hypothetical protein